MDKKIIIIPTYNEKNNIEKLIETLTNIILDIDILVVDDNSPDGTSDVVREISKKNKKVFLITRTTGKGYGQSLKTGFDFSLENQYKVIATMDADFSHNPLDLIKMLDIHEEGILIGSRYIKGGDIEGWNIVRKMLSNISNRFAKLYLNFDINDLTAGFRVYTNKSLQLTNYNLVNLNGYAFLVTLLHNARLNKVVLNEFPVTFVNRKIGKSKMSLKIIFEAVLNVLKLKFQLKY